MAPSVGEVPDDLIAMPAAAARFAGVSQRQLRYWDETHLLSPGVKRQLSERNTVRLYRFPSSLSYASLPALNGCGCPFAGSVRSSSSSAERDMRRRSGSFASP
jgi:hypothetical protein